MRKPDCVIEIFLRPGELYFGDHYTRIRTVLGSCVSLVFWHPTRLLGGMCHYMLPGRASRHPAQPLDGRYGDEAIELILAEIRAAGAHPREFRVRVFGGADMFPGIKKREPVMIGRKNVEAARQMIEAHQLHCSAAHVEGTGHRNLLFDVWNGRVTMKMAAAGLEGEADQEAA